MLWADDDDDYEITTLKQKAFIEERLDICVCGEQMQIIDNNGTKQYICYTCGQINYTEEAFDIKLEETIEFEEKRIEYGNKSGENYMRTVREEILLEIKKVSKIIPISEAQSNAAMKNFLIMRSNRIPRARPRKGLISACIINEIKVPIEKISAIFGISQKYITDGIKAFNKHLLPFDKVSIETLVLEFLNNVREFFDPSFYDNYKQIIVDFVKICYYYYIGYDTTIKTKCIGIIYYICQVKDITMPQEFINYTGIGKNTLYKFFDKLVVYLHAKSVAGCKYPQNFNYRRLELNRFIESRGLKLIQIQLKGRFLKFLDTYEF